MKKKQKNEDKIHIKTTRRTRKLKLSSGAFILPSFLGVMAFFILPFLVVVVYSLVDSPITNNFVLFENYK